MILVIAEHRGGRLNRASWEVITAAQQLAAGEPITVVLPGADVSTAGSGIAIHWNQPPSSSRLTRSVVPSTCTSMMIVECAMPSFSARMTPTCAKP